MTMGKDANSVAVPTWRNRLTRLRKAGFPRRAIPYASRRIWQSFYFGLQTQINRFQLWLQQAKVGTGLRTMGLVDIDLVLGSRLIIGNNVSLCSSKNRYNLALYGPVKFRCLTSTAQIIIEDGVYLNGTSIACRSQTISIGTGTIFAGNVMVMDSDFHRLWPPDQRLYFPDNDLDASVTIGENCWFGLNVTILKGAKIGDNVVVGAGSVVTGELPSNCVAAGSPAQVIKHLP